MKKEILLIVTLILIEIFIMYGKMIYNLTDLYIIIIVLAIIFLVGNIFLWKRNKETANKKGNMVIIAIFIILTILKVSYIISIKIVISSITYELIMIFTFYVVQSFYNARNFKE